MFNGVYCYEKKPPKKVESLTFFDAFTIEKKILVISCIST